MIVTYLFAGILLLGLAYIIFRIIVRRDYLRKSKLSFFSYTMEFAIFALHANFMYLYIPEKWPNLPNFPEDAIIKLAVLFLLSAGLIILFIAMTGLGFKSSFGKDKNKLKVNGIYKYSRNPQIVGYGLIIFALFLNYPSYYAVGWVLMFCVIAGFMIRTEEEFLLLAYDKEYKKYCNKVPRLIKLK